MELAVKPTWSSAFFTGSGFSASLREHVCVCVCACVCLRASIHELALSRLKLSPLAVSCPDVASLMDLSTQEFRHVYPSWVKRFPTQCWSFCILLVLEHMEMCIYIKTFIHKSSQQICPLPRRTWVLLSTLLLFLTILHVYLVTKF